MFKNRYEASVLLCEKLLKFRGRDGIVLAIPRGGVPVGYEVAQELQFPLEVILSKKIGHPFNKEYAVGAVSLQGVIVDRSIKGVSEDYIKTESEKLVRTLEQKQDLFMQGRKASTLKNKTVLLVDDGIATGNTVLSIIKMIRQQQPAELIIAVPVASPDSVDMLSPYVDEFIYVMAPANFQGVGQFYDDFSQTTDEEVIELLEDSRQNLTK